MKKYKNNRVDSLPGVFPNQECVTWGAAKSVNGASYEYSESFSLCQRDCHDSKLDSFRLSAKIEIHIAHLGAVTLCGGPSINALSSDPPSIGYDRTVGMCGAAGLARGMPEFRIFLSPANMGDEGTGQKAVMGLGPILVFVLPPIITALTAAPTGDSSPAW